MTYELEFLEEAWKEWQRLDSTIKAQFKKKLKERLEHPCVESARLKSLSNCYKIKLRNLGYRLVYRVEQEKFVVLVIAVGKRERNLVYASATQRIE